MQSEGVTMARSILIFIFLFLFSSSVYAGKAIAPTVTALPPINILSDRADMLCSFNTGSASGDLSYYVSINDAAFFLEYTYYGFPGGQVVNRQQTRTLYPISSGNKYEYYCTVQTSVGTATSNIISFCLGPCPGEAPPSCTLTANPSAINFGSSSTISFNSTLADTFSITYPGNNMSVTPNVPGSFPISPGVTTSFIGTVTNAAGQANCDATVIVNNVPPISNTLGATTSLFYPHGFEVQCSNSVGTFPMRLFLRLISGGVSTDYTYIEVFDVSTYGPEFLSETVWTYGLYIPPAYRSYYIIPETLNRYFLNPTFLSPNTLYQYQCCSENSYGISCGDTAGPGGSIYTSPNILTFDYNFMSDWPHLVSYGRSIWSISVNLSAECFKSWVGRIEIIASVNGVIQPLSGYDLVYDITGDGIPEKNSSSNFSAWDLNHNGYLDVGDDYNYWNSHSDAYRWDTNRDGILDLIDAGSGRPICGVVYISGHEHFFTCPVGVSIGKPVFAVVDVGADGVGCLPKNVVGSAVIIPFGNFYLATKFQDKGLTVNYKQGNLKRAGRIGFGAGGFERVLQ